MNKRIETGLNAARDALESIKPADLSSVDLADLGGRLKALDALVEKTRAAIADQVRTERRGKPGEILGESFRALYRVQEYNRIDVVTLREKRPEIAAKFTIVDRVPTVTFATR